MIKQGRIDNHVETNEMGHIVVVELISSLCFEIIIEVGFSFAIMLYSL